MVFQIIALSTAFIGSSLSAIWDLKTTEIPDHIPHAMIVIGLLLYAVQSYLTGSYWPIVDSAIVGCLLLAFGFFLYFIGQWGGGDAKVLAAIGFLLPQPVGFAQTFFPFPLSYLINVFVVGAIYMLFYAVVLAVRNKKIINKFVKDVKASSNVLTLGSIGLFATFAVINLFFLNYYQVSYTTFFLFYNSLLPLVLTLSVIIVWKFAKAVEDMGFKKKISLSKLRVGDVLMENKRWEGITEKQLKKIKKSQKKFVWIKEGIRFAPAFPLALLFTLYFGDVILLFRLFI